MSDHDVLKNDQESGGNQSVVVASLGGLLGLVFFLIIFGINLLDPTSIDWQFTYHGWRLIPYSGDSILTAVGWQFFRFESWHFPLGDIRSYGALGSSVMSTGILPLLAIPFKLFNGLLPVNFQYIGMWILLCYVLQGVFAVILLRQITDNRFFCLIGAVFFITSAIMLTRVALGHYVLLPHWLILYALWLNVRVPTARQYWHWLGLITVAALTFPYLYVMVMGLFFADCLRHLFICKKSSGEVVFCCFMGVLLFSVLLLWLMGSFQSGAYGFSAGGFGYFSMNLNAIFNPMWFSRLFPKLGMFFYQYEGFNYLGAGIIFLLYLTCMKLFTEPQLVKQVFKNQWPLIIVLIFFTLFALSNVVTLNDWVVFTVHIPAALQFIASIFRSSGRFFWPMYYAIFFAVLWILDRLVTARYQLKFVVLIAALSLQLFDFSEAFIDFRKANINAANTSWKQMLKSDFWSQAVKKYHKIIFVPNQPYPPYYYAFALLAANHGMVISNGYTARLDMRKMVAISDKIMRDFTHGQLDQDALYIVSNKFLISPQLRALYRIDNVDGFTVVTLKG